MNTRAAGLTGLLELLAEHGDTPEDPVPVAIETPRGLLTACLRSTGRTVYPINPMAVARYRDRHSAAGRKSDHGDAVVLANVLRTDAHAHRPLPADTELAQAIAVLARAQQDAVWARTGAHNKLRSHLREYYPAFLGAFNGARGSDQALVWSARSMGASRLRMLWDVVVPSALPEMLNGVRTALALAFILLVSAELIVAREGLGYMIGFLGSGGVYDAMFAVVLTVALLGFAADRAYQGAMRRVLLWRA